MADKIPFEPFVAIDVGSFSLKFAYVIPGTGDKPILKAIAHMVIPPFVHQLSADDREKMSRDDVEKDSQTKLQKFLTKHLTELLYDNQIQTKKGITLASGRPVTIRYFEIPPVAEKEMLDAAVNAEAMKQMPFSMENAVFGFTLLGDMVRDEKALQQFMVAALQKDIVSVIAENLKGGGLSNEGILTLPQALELGIPGQLELKSGKEAKVAIIHCGHKTTSIMIYKNGRLNFYRDINMGGETITEAIFTGSEDFEGQKITFEKYEEATELKHKIGVLPPDEMATLKGPEKFAAQQIFATVEKIFQHIQLSISFYISQFGESGVEKIILSGGAASMKNFKDFIQESLEVPAEIANPFAELSVDEVNLSKEQLEIDAPAFAGPIGIAKYQEEPDIINFINILFPNRKAQTMDFSKVSSRFSSGIGQRFNIQLDERKIKILLGLLLMLILLGVCYPFVKIRQDLTQAKSDLKMYQSQLNELRSTQTEVTALLEEKDRLAKEAGFADEMGNFSFPFSEMLLELLKLTPREVFVQKLNLIKEGNNRKFRLVGHADTSDRVFEYLRILGGAVFFKNPTLESTEEVSIDADHYFMQFTLSGDIRRPDPPAKPDGEEDAGDSSPGGGD
jgi:type IV pilus assembly protein PilM